MILEQTFHFTFNQIVFLAGALIAVGGNYWLLVHLGQEGSKIKEDVKKHGEHIASSQSDIENLKQSASRIENKIDNLLQK